MPSIYQWGPSCWIFFHTLVKKIKPEYFLQIRDPLMHQIKNICFNLPCPTCSNHSKMFFGRQGPLDFKTKEECEYFFWFFHNHVNRQKRKSEYPATSLSSYNDKHLRQTYEEFARQYTAKDNGLKLMSETFHRKGILKGFHKWIILNNKCFIN